ncbi:hypothetical protein GCM10025795_08870 [Verticiella sediminum]
MASQVKAERVPQVARVFVAVNAETFDRLKDVVSAAQHERLKQIEIQTFGVRAFGRPEVIDELGLTVSQQDALRLLGTDTGERLAGIQRSTSLTAAEKSRLAGEIRGSALRDARKHLSAEQWVKWELLTGAAFAR